MGCEHKKLKKKMKAKPNSQFSNIHTHIMTKTKQIFMVIKNKRSHKYLRSNKERKKNKCEQKTLQCKKQLNNMFFKEAQCQEKYTYDHKIILSPSRSSLLCR